MVKRLLAGEPERSGGCLLPVNSKGSTPMPTRFERWMRSKLSAITARTPKQLAVPLAAQSRLTSRCRRGLPATITSGVSSAW